MPRLRVYKAREQSKADHDLHVRLHANAADLLEEVEAMLADLEDWLPDEPTISGSEDELKYTVLAVRDRIKRIRGV